MHIHAYIYAYIYIDIDIYIHAYIDIDINIMKILIFLLSVLLVLSASVDLPPQNPVIGIYTQTHTNTASSKSSYIAASYVKFIEMSGAQVVPIYSFSDTTEVLALLKKINGVLFPGTK